MATSRRSPPRWRGDSIRGSWSGYWLPLRHQANPPDRYCTRRHLVAHGFPADSAADLLRTAQQEGLRGPRLLDVAVAASHELQREGGRTPAEALARVRAMMPNVPVATPPHPRAVTRRAGPGS